MGQTNYTVGGIAWGATPTLIRDIRSGQVNPNASKLFLGGSGGVHRTFAAMASMKPQLNFVTGDIRNALNTFDGISPTGFSSSEFVAYLKQMEDGGLVKSGSSHLKMTVVKGLLVPATLTIPGDASTSATINYLLHMISSDGSTAPMTTQTGQALYSGSDQGAEAFTLGPVTLNGSLLEGVDNVSVTFGWTPWVLAGDGHLYPTFACGTKQSIMIAITARNAEAFASWGLSGQAQSVTDSTIVINDVAEGTGVRGADPVTMTIDAGLMHTDGFSFSDGQPAENSIVIEVTWDTVADPIVFSGLT